MTTAADFHVQRTSPTRLGRVGFVLAALILATGVWLAVSIAVDASPAAAEGESATYPSTPQTVAPLELVCPDGFVPATLGGANICAADYGGVVHDVILCADASDDLANCELTFLSCPEFAFIDQAWTCINDRAEPLGVICPAGSTPSGLTCVLPGISKATPPSPTSTATPQTVPPVEFICPAESESSMNGCLRFFVLPNSVDPIAECSSGSDIATCDPADLTYRCPAGTTRAANQADRSDESLQCEVSGGGFGFVTPLGVRCPAGSTPSGLTCVLVQTTSGAATTAPTATPAPAATPAPTTAPAPTAVAVTVITTPAMTSGVVMSAADAGFTNGIASQPATVRQPPLAVTGSTIAPWLLTGLGFIALGASVMATRNRRQASAAS